MDMIAAGEPRLQSPPSSAQLFLGFMQLSLMAFGGVLPWARKVLAEDKGWLTPAEFTHVLGLCQFLPGPNIVNLAIVVGARHRGPMGAFAAVMGLLVGPFLIVVALGALYDRYGQIAFLRDLIGGVAAAAAGLIVAMALKMAVPLLRERPVGAGVFLVAALLAVTVLHLALWWVLLIFVPPSIATAWWQAFGRLPR